jgi:hypothetical protein
MMETVEDVVMGTEEVGYEEVYDEEVDDEEEYDEETYLIGKARALLSGPLRALNRPNDTNWLDLVSTLDDIFKGIIVVN